MEIRCPHCNASQQLSDEPSRGSVGCTSCGESYSLGSFLETFELPAPTTDPQRHRECVQDFKREWEAGKEPELDSFLSQGGGRIDLLVDLIHIDIRFRWLRNNGIRTEDYLERYPQLRSRPDSLFALFEEEYLARYVNEPALTPAIFAQRYFDVVLSPGVSVDPLLATCDSSPPVTDGDQTQSWSSEEFPMIGKFRLLSLAGKGAFGEVYRAYDTELDRHVAIKLARSDGKASTDEVDRGREEARNAARLAHPGIVPIFEVGEHETGSYIVSEFVNGVTLADYLTGKRLHFTEATAVDQACIVGIDACASSWRGAPRFEAFQSHDRRPPPASNIGLRHGAAPWCVDCRRHGGKNTWNPSLHVT